METVQIDACMRIVSSVRRCLRAATKGFCVYQRKDSVCITKTVFACRKELCPWSTPKWSNWQFGGGR